MMTICHKTRNMTYPNLCTCGLQRLNRQYNIIEASPSWLTLAVSVHFSSFCPLESW